MVDMRGGKGKVCVGAGEGLHLGRVGRVGVYDLVGSLQWMGYPILGPTLVSTFSTQSFLIPNSAMSLEVTSNFQVGYEYE